MSSQLEVFLARGDTDDPSDWAWVAGAFELYLLIGYGLEYRAKKRRGVERPVKAAARGLFHKRDGNDPWQHFASRMVMLCGALAVGLAGYFTRHAPAAVQFLVGRTAALLGIFAWAYFDHRSEPRSESKP
jgi:hypothetical protein